MTDIFPGAGVNCQCSLLHNAIQTYPSMLGPSTPSCYNQSRVQTIPLNAYQDKRSRVELIIRETLCGLFKVLRRNIVRRGEPWPTNGPTNDHQTRRFR